MDRCHRRIGALTLVSAALAAVAPLALAQVARSGGNANRELLAQMQQLASERTALQAENQKLKSELADVKKDRDALKTGQQAVERRAQGAAAALAQSTSQREATDKELAQYKSKMQELIDKFRETIQKLRETETSAAADKQTLAARERELSVCVDRNVALYHLNDEVLARLDKTGFWQKAAMAEPFTRIKRIQNENLVDEYRNRAQEQRVTSPPAAAPATSGASAPPASPAADSTATPKTNSQLR